MKQIPQEKNTLNGKGLEQAFHFLVKGTFGFSGYGNPVFPKVGDFPQVHIGQQKGLFFLPVGCAVWVKGKVIFGNCYGFHLPAFSSCRYIFLMRSSTLSEESLARIRSVMRGKEKGVGWLHSRHTIVCFWIFSKTCVIRPRSIP